jgi:hypothetical protein
MDETHDFKAKMLDTFSLSSHLTPVEIQKSINSIYKEFLPDKTYFTPAKAVIELKKYFELKPYKFPFIEGTTKRPTGWTIIGYWKN